MDIVTILIMLIVGHFLVMVLTYSYYKNHTNYILQISFIAQVLFVLAYLALLYRALIPSKTGIILANSLLISAIGVQSAAVLYSIDAWHKKVRGLYILLMSASMLCFYVYVFNGNKDSIRIALISSITAGILVYPTYKLLTDSKSTLYRKILGGMCSFALIAFMIRVVNVLQPSKTFSLLSSSFSNSLSFVTLFALMIINGVGLILLIKENDDAKLYTAATRDVLTGIYNRAKLISEAEKQIEMHQRKTLPMGFMVIDIDHFKRINDQFGHSFGDIVLKELTLNIAQHLRNYDILGRVGGEEFVVILPNTTVEESLIVSERLRFEIENCPIQNCCITVSIGLWASEITSEMTFTQIFIAADHALYKAKNEGRNRVCLVQEVNIAEQEA